MRVFVLDKHKHPLMPCHPARARQLLQARRAVVHRHTPFTIRLKDRLVAESMLQPLVLGVDPGSQTTGLALAREEAAPGSDGPVRHALWLAELRHRGQQVRHHLQQRAAFRRRRRSANLRYRAPRFANRRLPVGWLSPSLRSRVDNIVSWTARLRRWAPVARIALETVRFDTQLVQNPEVSGVEYQQGTLAGYELRQYLLEKWGRQCAYCDAASVPLQVEHIQPKRRGGSDRVSNLTLACGPCNQRKGAHSVQAFLAQDPPRLARLLAQAEAPLRDAAAVNATRWALHRRLAATGLPVEVATGGRTQWNRARLLVPKSHAVDALCAGVLGAVQGWQVQPLGISAMGRGSYQRTRLTRFGFPRGYLARQKTHFGFRTGDLVRAVVPAGKHAGVHVGRVAVRASGGFNLRVRAALRQGLSHRHCRLVQRADGYAYATHSKKEAAPGWAGGVSSVG